MEATQTKIDSRPCPACPICEAEGQLLYERLTDALYGAPGEWSLRTCNNPNCGSLWLDPMPLEQEIAKAYRNYYTHQAAGTLRHRFVQFIKRGYLAHRYGYQQKEVHALQKTLGLLAYLAAFRRGALDNLVKYLTELPHGHLLEVGCGDGQILEFMQNLGWTVEGVDFDSLAVESARRKGLRVRLGKLQTQQYAENTFDAIVMSHVIEHVHQPDSLLRECHRVLKPGGKLVVLTPNARSWGHRKFRRCWRGLEPPRHLQVFTPQSLHRLTQQAGFSRNSICTTLRNAGKILQASRSIQRTGKFAPGSRPSVSVFFWLFIMQLQEWVYWKRDPAVGEEIDMVAEK